MRLSRSLKEKRPLHAQRQTKTVSDVNHAISNRVYKSHNVHEIKSAVVNCDRDRGESRKEPSLEITYRGILARCEVSYGDDDTVTQEQIKYLPRNNLLIRNTIAPRAGEFQPYQFFVGRLQNRPGLNFNRATDFGVRQRIPRYVIRFARAHNRSGKNSFHYERFRTYLNAFPM